MTFILITYGAGEILASTFNALAALLNSHTGTLYASLIRLGLIVGLLWATVLMVYGEKAHFIHHWLIPFYLALSLFFAPTCRLHIHDPVNHTHKSVDHVPWGLGMVAGIISQIGDTLTREIERVFSLPDDFKYHKTGAVLASNLIANARTFQIENVDLAETLKSFMVQCVVYDALLGNKYTLQNVRNAPDIWKLACENPSPSRCFLFKEPGKSKKPELVTCQRGVALLNPLLKTEVQNVFQWFEGKIFGTTVQNSSTYSLKHYLPLAFNEMTGLAKSAEDTMMQQLMMSSLVDTLETESGTPGVAPDFATRRAYLQGRSNQETLAGVTTTKLIAMKHVMEALVYVAFLVILPLALLPGGWTYIGRWISLVLWVQLWAPLYAVLNFIAHVSARAKGAGSIMKAGGITLANSVGFMNLHADMAAQAGFMAISVGALAYALVKGGAGAFVHLASHLASPVTNAAAQASESLMTGNYGFGNVTSGILQASNTTFGQHNFSPSYSSATFTQHEGEVSRSTTASGEHFLNVSTSTLRSQLQLSESLSETYTEQANKNQQLAESQLVASAHAQAEHNRHVLDFSQHQAQQKASTETSSHGTSASQSTSFQHLNNLVERFAQDHSLSKETAQQVLANASVSFETGTGFSILGLIGASTRFQATASGQISSTTTDRELFSSAQEYAKQSQFQEAFSNAETAAHEVRKSELTEEGHRSVRSMQEASESSRHLRKEASVSFQKVASFSKLATWTKQNAGNINANLSQEYVSWLQNQALPNAQGPMGITSAQALITHQPSLNQVYQQRFLEEKIRTHAHPFDKAP